jgi:hypothetical protein
MGLWTRLVNWFDKWNTDEVVGSPEMEYQQCDSNTIDGTRCRHKAIATIRIGPSVEGRTGRKTFYVRHLCSVHHRIYLSLKRKTSL